jgi:hypothetical protein
VIRTPDGYRQSAGARILFHGGLGLVAGPRLGKARFHLAVPFSADPVLSCVAGRCSACHGLA